MSDASPTPARAAPNGPAWRDDLAFAARHLVKRLRRTRRKRGSDPAAEAGGPLPRVGSTVEIDGIVMRVDARMSPFNVRKLLDGRHTVQERTLLGRRLREDDRVMELGGGIGMVAIACAKRLGSERVVSYEPNPELEDLIRDNYALNGVSPSLRMAMVGREAGTRTFHLAARFSRSSAHMKEAGSRSVEVPVEPYGEAVRRARPSVLVVDIQGGERELLEHADLSGVRGLLIELHPFIIGLRAMLAIRRRLRRLGFVERDALGSTFFYERPATGRDGGS